MNLNFSVTPEPLPSQILERGEVLKSLIYQNLESDSISEIAILELYPGAKIKLHTHTTDAELYFCYDTKTGSICLIGESHYLENTSNEKMKVLSIKCNQNFILNQIKGIFAE